MTQETMQVTIETTDTFAGEANYCWCERTSLELPVSLSERAIVRRMKSTAGITAKHDKDSYGDMLVLDYRGLCVRSFITFE